MLLRRPAPQMPEYVLLSLRMSLSLLAFCSSLLCFVVSIGIWQARACNGLPRLRDVFARAPADPFGPLLLLRASAWRAACLRRDRRRLQPRAAARGDPAPAAGPCLPERSDALPRRRTDVVGAERRAGLWVVGRGVCRADGAPERPRAAQPMALPLVSAAAGAQEGGHRADRIPEGLDRRARQVSGARFGCSPATRPGAHGAMGARRGRHVRSHLRRWRRDFRPDRGDRHRALFGRLRDARSGRAGGRHARAAALRRPALRARLRRAVAGWRR